jgi:general secretion pathway protein G
MNTKTKQSGFSLLEVMVAVCIMAIMSAMLVPSLYNHFVKAENIRVANDLRQIATQSKLFYLDNYRLPSRVEQMVPQYFMEVPSDPWGADYEISRDKKKYVVVSAGRDGRMNTKDDIKHVVDLRGYRNARR